MTKQFDDEEISEEEIEMRLRLANLVWWYFNGGEKCYIITVE